MIDGNNLFLNKVKSLLSSLEGNEELADADLLTKLETHLRGLDEQFDRIMNTNRDLKLGIVGRVKAGKSSFLNALLFEGQDRLPRAATPMTAALTRLNYAPAPEDQQAIVHYYSKGDWGRIEEQARKLQQTLDSILQRELEENRNKFRFQAIVNDPTQLDGWKRERCREILSHPPTEIETLKNCAELVEMARNKGVSHRNLQRDEEGRDQYSIPLNTKSGDNFFTNLDEYVGAQGKYTPFVKYIELKLHDDRLDGIEVVDTPGLNDPITSRVDVTNRFLRECDAVLLLSGVSHFLDANDADLAGRQIREASIKRAYIIGTMVDTGLLECPQRNVDLQDAYNICKASYQNQARDFRANLIRHCGSIPEGMDSEDGPQLVSSMLYAISRKMRENMPFNEGEQHILNRFEKTFPGYRKLLETADDFEDVSGFADVKECVYAPVRADKERILRERVAAFQSEQAAIISGMLEDIAISADRRKSLLENNDVAELKGKQATMQSNLQNSRIEVRNIFDELQYNCKKAVSDLKVNMRQAMSGFQSVNVESVVKTRKWITGWILKDYYFETYTVRRASASEASGNIEGYGQECMRLISTCVADMFNRDRLERHLRNAIYDTFQSADADSGKADILGPVHALLSRIGVPEIDYSGLEDAKKNIFNQFSSEVTDSEIEDLKIALSAQLAAVYDNYAAKVDAMLAVMTNAMEKNSASFVDTVCDKVQAAYETLLEQLENKDKNIQLYKEFSARMKMSKKEFLIMEN